jgi:hypothetical protein
MMPLVSAELGKILPNRDLLLGVLNRLYDRLGNHYQQYKNRRDPNDEFLFDYFLWTCDGEKWQTLRFSVDDCKADGHLFIVAMSSCPGKARV